MAEEAENPSGEPTGKKKKGKLPIILVLVLLLAGGGFFAMKIRSGKAKVEVALSKDKPTELKEFLVNLRDQGVYCRTEIALGVAEGVKPTIIDDHEDAVRDAINLCLSSKRLAEINAPGGLNELKREIASAVNKALADPKRESKPEDGNGDGTDQAPTTPPDKKAAPAAGQNAQPTAPTHPDWDSDTGPVLKVYFSSFATQ